MASESHPATGKIYDVLPEHEWISPLLPSNEDRPNSYVRAEGPPTPRKEKRTTLSKEAKELAKSSVGLPH